MMTDQKQKMVQVQVHPDIRPEVEKFMTEDHRGNITNAMNKLAVWGLEYWRQSKSQTTPFNPSNL